MSPGHSAPAATPIARVPIAAARPRAPLAPSGQAGDADPSALSLLLRIEALCRDATDIGELRHLMVNETRKLNRARQIFVVEIDARGAAKVTAVSGASVLDPRSLLVDAVRTLVGRMAREHSLNKPVEFTLPAFSDPASDLAKAYPFREMAWQPLLDRRKAVFAGLLMARETVWGASDTAVAERLAGTYAHAWRELATAARFRPARIVTRPWWLAIALATALLAVPLPMTVLAPVEIVAREPMIVSAPIDGVIETVEVDPSARVRAGDVVVRLSDTALRSRQEIARQEVAVGDAKVRQANLLAFNDAKGRHDLGIAQAELELKRAELNYARDLLERSVIRAARDGIAVYPDRRALAGKPVATGERIMEIADPVAVEARIDLAVPDAIALTANSRVKLFLDVDPLQPWNGQVVRSDYRARPSDSDVLAFKTVARLDATERAAPRIGLRGTAQVYGDQVPLAVFLLRRPISAARQWLGL